jgi:hypothetical protein
MSLHKACIGSAVVFRDVAGPSLRPGGLKHITVLNQPTLLVPMPSCPIMATPQVDNEEAIRFYERHGFSRGDTVAGYYKKLAQPDAVIVRRKLVA